MPDLEEVLIRCQQTSEWLETCPPKLKDHQFHQVILRMAETIAILTQWMKEHEGS